MASQELELNPMLRAVQPDRPLDADLRALGPCDALLVPERAVFTKWNVEESHITADFLRHHALRFGKVVKGRKQDFTTASGVSGIFGEDNRTVQVGMLSLDIVRRISSDVIRAAASGVDQLDTEEARGPPRRSGSSLLRRSSSNTKAPQRAVSAVPDVFIVNASLYPLQKIAPDRSTTLMPPSPTANGAPTLTGGATGLSSEASGQRPFDGTFGDFQAKLLNERQLRSTAKRIKAFLSKAMDGARDRRPVPPEEVRNFIASAADEMAEHWELWATTAPASDAVTPQWAVDVREHTERYVVLKLHEVLLRPVEGDVDFAAHREVLLATEDANLPANVVSAVPESQRRSWRKAVEALEDVARWKVPAEKAQSLERCLALLRQSVGNALLRSAQLTASETPADAVKQGVDRHLATAVRFCVLHHQGTNPLAQLNFVESYRALAGMSGDLRSAIEHVRSAVEFWTRASPAAAKEELEKISSLLVSSLGANAVAAGAATTSERSTAAGDSAATNGGAVASGRSISSSARNESFGAAAAEAESRDALVHLVRQLNQSFDRPEAMPEGSLGRLPLDRVDVIDEDELARRKAWDAEHEAELQRTRQAWEEELARRTEAETEIGAADKRWEEAQVGVARLQETRSAELDSMDESRLAAWESNLIKLSALTDDAYAAARHAWTSYAEEVDKTNAATSDHFDSATRHLDAERAELERRAAALTDGHKASSARLAEVHEGLEECLRSFHAARAQQQQRLDEDRAAVQRTLAEGLAAQRTREEELAARERQLEERRAALDAWLAQRDAALTERAAQLDTLDAERQAAVEEMRAQLTAAIEAREGELTARAADLDAREEALGTQQAAAAEAIQAREEELRSHRAAVDAHAKEVRAALEAELAAGATRVRASEAAAKEARDAAELRLAEVKRATAAAQEVLRERSAALDRRQAEVERRQKVHAIAEERAQQALEQRVKEILHRADADRQAIADIQANLRSREEALRNAEAALKRRTEAMEEAMQKREAAATAKVDKMRGHCRGEFQEALKVLRETDAVDHVADFHSLSLKDLDGLWRTMSAFRSVKERFGGVVAQFDAMDAAIASRGNSPQPQSPVSPEATAAAE